MANIRVLTYNVSWQSMSGKIADWAHCNNNVDPESAGHFSHCIKNIVQMIDSYGPYDFITLQEASKSRVMIKTSKILPGLESLWHKSGAEEMIMFWDPKKYHLITNDIVLDEFQKGRPWQFIPFEENIAVLNIHAGHYDRDVLIANLDILVSRIHNKMKPNSRLIIAGDFNFAVTDPTKGFGAIVGLSGMTFYINQQVLPTCCVPPFKKFTLQFDNVLDSGGVPISVVSPQVEGLASDHLPLLYELVPLGQSGGSDLFYQKYNKYKQKYLLLKYSLRN